MLKISCASLHAQNSTGLFAERLRSQTAENPGLGLLHAVRLGQDAKIGTDVGRLPREVMLLLFIYSCFTLSRQFWLSSSHWLRGKLRTVLELKLH